VSKKRTAATAHRLNNGQSVIRQGTPGSISRFNRALFLPVLTYRLVSIYLYTLSQPQLLGFSPYGGLLTIGFLEPPAAIAPATYLHTPHYSRLQHRFQAPAISEIVPCSCVDAQWFRLVLPEDFLICLGGLFYFESRSQILIVFPALDR